MTKVFRLLDENILLATTDGNLVLVNGSTGIPISSVTSASPIEVYNPVVTEIYVLTTNKLYKYSQTLVFQWEASVPSLGPMVISGYSGGELTVKGVNGSGFIVNWVVNHSTGGTVETTELAFIGFGNLIRGNMLIDTVSQGIRIRNHVLGTSLIIPANNPSLVNSIIKSYGDKWYFMISHETEFGGMDYMLVILNSAGNAIENTFTGRLGNGIVDDQFLDFQVTETDILVITANPFILKLNPSSMTQQPLFIELDVPTGFTSKGGYISPAGDFWLYGSITEGDLLISGSVNTVAGPRAVSELSSISSLTNFQPTTFNYSLAIPNSTNSVDLSFTVSDGQEVLVYINGMVVDNPSQIIVPIGTSEIRIISVSENGANTSEYLITVTRAVPSDGLIYVDSQLGLPNSAGTSSLPVRSFKRAMLQHPGSTLALKIKDFLPNYSGTNFSFTASPVRGTNLPIQVTSGVNILKMKNPNPNYVYLFSPVGTVRNNAIMSFILKVLDPTSDEFITGGPFEIEINAPYYASRTHLRLFREDDNTEVTGGLVYSNSSQSTYTISLTTNSVYSIVDSGSFQLSGGVGSDPHVTTIFGRKYDIPKQYRYSKTGMSLLKTLTGEIRGRITGLPNGEFLTKAEVTIGNHRVMDIDFERGKTRILSNGEVRKVEVSNNMITNIRRGTKTTEMFLINSLWEGGVYLMVNYQHRYICPVFNKHPLPTDPITGVLVK